MKQVCPSIEDVLCFMRKEDNLTVHPMDGRVDLILSSRTEKPLVACISLHRIEFKDEFDMKMRLFEREVERKKKEWWKFQEGHSLEF